MATKDAEGAEKEVIAVQPGFVEPTAAIPGRQASLCDYAECGCEIGDSGISGAIGARPEWAGVVPF